MLSRISSNLKSIKSTKLVLGIILFMSLVVLVTLEPAINNYRLQGANPLSAGTFQRYLPPSYEHPLGTDQWGRDLFAMALIGLKFSLQIGIISGGFSTLIAIVVALMGGWWRGIVDDILNYITNAILVIPVFPIIIAIAIYVRTGLIELSLLLVLFSWPWAARTIRAQVLSLREQPYIDMARVTNLRGIEIIFEEIFPNIVPYVITTFSGAVISTMMAETGLRLIGVGPAEIPSIGYFLEQASRWGVLTTGAYNVIVPPILFLIVTFISLNLINVGLDERFNPKLRKVTGE